MKPKVYIIAGPNGAGKTTFAREFLPLYADCRNFINADLIAEGISPFSPELAGVRAGRLMLNEINRFGQRGIDFGFETTLSGRTLFNSVLELRNRGYEVHLFYLWVSKVELCIDRVKERVRRGGHNVPEADVRRRYNRSIRNFFMNYRNLCESWTLFDNSGETPEIVASGEKHKLRIMRSGQYENLVARYGGK